jgi:hypothetical protein
VSARRWLVFCLRRRIYWRDQQAGYTEDLSEAGQYSDAEALDIAERMNGGGDCPVQLIAVDEQRADALTYAARSAWRGRPQ